MRMNKILIAAVVLVILVVSAGGAAYYFYRNKFSEPQRIVFIFTFILSASVAHAQDKGCRII